ncbi:MAG: hypothetical protein AB7G37_00965 [Solirubrobacteraceae bacterium]
MTKTTRSKAPAKKKTAPARLPRLLPVVRDLPIETVEENARLNGAKVDVLLRRAITGIERELTIDGANILSLGLEDDGWEILRSPLLEGAVDLNLSDEGRWRWDRTRDTGGISVQGTAATLRLWCLTSGALRAQTSPLTKASAKMDIAGWTAWLAREQGVRALVPGLRTVVPLPGEAPPADTTTETSTTTRRTSGTSKGFANPPKSVQRYDGPVPMTASRLKIADELLATADRLKAGPKATLALMMAGLVESSLTNTGWTDGANRSRGVLQARPGVSAGPRGTITAAQANDVAYMAECFLKDPGFSSRGGAIKLAKANPSWTAGHVAWMVEQPAAQYRDRYDRSRAGAEALVKAWGGGSGGSSTSGGAAAVVRPSQWRRGIDGKPESSWTCLDRYARQMGRRRFIALPTSTRPRLVMAADQQLILAAPHLALNGLDDRILAEPPSIELEGIKRLQTIELVAFAHQWSAPPGAVVDVRESGPVDGPWLVQRLVQTGGDPLVRVTLQQPTTKVEAPPATSTAGAKRRSSSGSSAGAGPTDGRITTQGGAKGIVEQAYRLCREAGGSQVYVGSGYRPGSTTSSGNPSDHASNNAQQAARDIGKRGTNLLTGPPTPEVDRGAAALGTAFGRSYGDGRRTIIDTFTWRGYRVQIIWRTPLYGGHMGHIHIGVRRG